MKLGPAHSGMPTDQYHPGLAVAGQGGTRGQNGELNVPAAGPFLIVIAQCGRFTGGQAASTRRAG
jgi:hypothetical protein